VRQLKGGRHRLIAGGHRLQAVLDEGWAAVACRVWSGTGVTDDWCRLMEVDDNLAGAEMGALDTAVFLAERHRLYLKLHPEKAQGPGGASARWNATDIESFASATALKFNLSERHVLRLAAAGAAVLGDTATRLRTAPNPVRLADLIALAKADPDRRGDAIDRFVDGKAKRLAEALKAPVNAPVKDPVEAAFHALQMLWEKAPEAARRRFVGAYYSALGSRLQDERGRREVAQKLDVAVDDPSVAKVMSRFGPGKGTPQS
jgi:ParB family chromosome partitioning protein